jgi:hypothetical protein
MVMAEGQRTERKATEDRYKSSRREGHPQKHRGKNERREEAL